MSSGTNESLDSDLLVCICTRPKVGQSELHFCLHQPLHCSYAPLCGAGGAADPRHPAGLHPGGAAGHRPALRLLGPPLQALLAPTPHLQVPEQIMLCTCNASSITAGCWAPPALPRCSRASSTAISASWPPTRRAPPPLLPVVVENDRRVCCRRWRAGRGWTAWCGSAPGPAPAWSAPPGSGCGSSPSSTLTTRTGGWLPSSSYRFCRNDSESVGIVRQDPRTRLAELKTAGRVTGCNRAVCTWQQNTHQLVEH